ncbi:hypothetical protein [Candidatus Amarobacter glycogenicus]|uniref:hypothetical protein n=1 Tax=Candidatus Amarobacter glycogenicus TaxID=3140699 RepID=UPI00313723BC|nr:hypothetical protein [Dehalococcoidia bacterium]
MASDSPPYFDMTVETRSDASGNFSHDFSVRGKRNIRPRRLHLHQRRISAGITSAMCLHRSPVS